nr:MAG TPA: hypothetical protein [Bacteriophage sp.]
MRISLFVVQPFKLSQVIRLCIRIICTLTNQ